MIPLSWFCKIWIAPHRIHGLSWISVRPRSFDNRSSNPLMVIGLGCCGLSCGSQWVASSHYDYRRLADPSTPQDIQSSQNKVIHHHLADRPHWGQRSKVHPSFSALKAVEQTRHGFQQIMTKRVRVNFTWLSFKGMRYVFQLYTKGCYFHFVPGHIKCSAPHEV